MEGMKKNIAKIEEYEWEKWEKKWKRFERAVERAVKNKEVIIIGRFIDSETFNLDGKVIIGKRVFEFGNVLGIEEDIWHLIVNYSEKYKRKFLEKRSRFASIIYFFDN